MNKKLIISILIVLTLSIGIFYVYETYSPLSKENIESQKLESLKIPEKSDTISIVSTLPSSIPVKGDIKKEVVVHGADVFNLTSKSPSSVNGAVYSSNIVGYIAGGAFLLDWPSWLSDNWHDASKKSEGNDGLILTPKEVIPGRDFSDIVIAITKSDERNNAETLYTQDSNRKLGLVISEVFLNKTEDMRIYHVERAIENNSLMDTYYMDGVGKTAKVTFSADKDNFGKYSVKVRLIIQGLMKGSAPQG